MDKKKSLLFVCYGLGIGGIEKCLINLINAMPEDEFEIDLLLMNPEFNFLDSIKRKVNILDSFEYVMNTTDTLNDIMAHGGVHKNLAHTVRYVIFRILVKLGIKPWVVFKCIDKQYDIAIAYSQNDYSPYYVIDKTNAHKKIMWYHNGDYSRKGYAYKLDQAYYPKFDSIVTVSIDSKDMLTSNFPSIASQVITLMNFYDVNDIRKKSLEFECPVFSDKYFNIVTVGRLTIEKGADLAVAVCKRLLEFNKNIRWYWVGDGNQRVHIEKQICENQLQNNFILVGSRTNPYPYIRLADIYVQPSYYEAYSTTVFEARSLGKAIVATDVGGMKEQITSPKDGIIVPIDVESILNGICYLIDNPQLKRQIEDNTQKKEFDSTENMNIYRNTIFK